MGHLPPPLVVFSWAYAIRPTPRPRRGRKRDCFSKGRTYPVGELHQYFEESHVPGRRGVLNTPHPTAPKGTKTGWFFEGQHVSSCRGVLNTPTPRPQRGRKRDSFLKDYTYPVGESHQYFVASHVPGCRGVLHTPHHTPSTVAYIDPLFELSHVPGYRGVSNTPHQKPPTVAYTDPFFEPLHVPGRGIASVFRRIARSRL